MNARKPRISTAGSHPITAESLQALYPTGHPPFLPGRILHEELDAMVAVVEVFSRQARETYLITNNHFQRQAALNALELRHKLQRAPVPPPLLTADPESAPSRRQR
jgi:hypothetical protein